MRWSAVLAIGLAGVMALCASAPAARGGEAPPSGEWIVFASARDGDSELYAVRPDGRDLRRLTRNHVEDFAPAVSPDGARVAFVSGRSGDDDLYVMNLDGSGLRALTRNSARAAGEPIQDEAPSWSPDGRRLAFASNRFGGQFEILVMRARGTHVRRVTRTRRQVTDTIPDWSPDGRLIAFASDRVSPFNTEIYVVRPDGSGIRRLTFAAGGNGVLGDDSMPAWSPDGSRIAFVSNRDQQSEIYVMKADGSGQHRVLERPSRDDLFPRWSPDAARLVFASSGFEVGPDLFTVQLDGEGLTALTAGTEASWVVLP